jgi:NADPH-dependent 7-cyano-7-deazaguanine reductase QueF-like protein
MGILPLLQRIQQNKGEQIIEEQSLKLSVNSFHFFILNDVLPIALEKIEVKRSEE